MLGRITCELVIGTRVLNKTVQVESARDHEHQALAVAMIT